MRPLQVRFLYLVLFWFINSAAMETEIALESSKAVSLQQLNADLKRQTAEVQAILFCC